MSQSPCLHENLTTAVDDSLDNGWAAGLYQDNRYFWITSAHPSWSLSCIVITSASALIRSFAFAIATGRPAASNTAASLSASPTTIVWESEMCRYSQSLESPIPLWIPFVEISRVVVAASASSTSSLRSRIRFLFYGIDRKSPGINGFFCGVIVYKSTTYTVYISKIRKQCKIFFQFRRTPPGI